MDLLEIQKIIISVKTLHKAAKQIQQHQEAVSKAAKPLQEQMELIYKVNEPYIKMQKYVNEQNQLYAQLLDEKLNEQERSLKPFSIVAILSIVVLLLVANYFPIYLIPVGITVTIALLIGFLVKLKYDFSIFNLAKHIDLNKEKANQ